MSTSKTSRTRSEAQLNQKRLVDRVKHRENRKKNKDQLERIELEISQIRQSLDTITTRLGNPTLSQSPALPLPGTLEALQTNHESILRSSSHGFQALCGQLQHIPPQPIIATRTWSSTLPALRVLNCRCGIQHSDHFETLEHCSITGLYQTHVAFPQGMSATRNLPRNPPLPSMMLHSEADNFVTSLLTPFLRDLKAEKIETLLGAYLFAYRLMRWQLDPNPSTLMDVPSWLLPTPTQATFLHPVCIDFLPWPRLREYLCSCPDKDSPHSIKLYWDSVRLDLPPGCTLFAQDDEGRMAISKGFEEVALDIGNWRMGSPWADIFPHLLPLVES